MKTFGELTIEEKLELHRAHYEGKGIEYYAEDAWRKIERPAFRSGCPYRIALTDMVIPWDAIKPEYKWAARDQGGGVYLFKKEPRVGSGTWLSNTWRFSDFLNIDPGTKPWDQSLVRRPE